MVEVMIKVYFSPQRADNQIEYSFCGEIVTARIGEAENTFDFSALPDGELNIEESIETTLPVCPVISAKRINGILHLELLNWIGPDAPHESRFPEWVELPLPKDAFMKEEPAHHKAVIPWRTEQEIEAERAARLAEEREREERRKRIREGLTTAKTEAELRDILHDMAKELGII